MHCKFFVHDDDFFRDSLKRGGGRGGKDRTGWILISPNRGVLRPLLSSLCLFLFSRGVAAVERRRRRERKRPPAHSKSVGKYMIWVWSVCAFFPSFFFFSLRNFFPPKNTKPFQQQHPSTAFKKRKKSAS
jgi:hypothetical protein